MIVIEKYNPDDILSESDFRVFYGMNPPKWMLDIICRYPYDETYIDVREDSSNNLITISDVYYIENDNSKNISGIRPRIVLLQDSIMVNIEITYSEIHKHNNFDLIPFGDEEFRSKVWTPPEFDIFFIAIKTQDEYTLLPERFKI